MQQVTNSCDDGLILVSYLPDIRVEHGDLFAQKHRSEMCEDLFTSPEFFAIFNFVSPVFTRSGTYFKNTSRTL